MRRRTTLVFMLIMLIALTLTGCGSRPYCTLTIHTVYGGYGIAGQDLGHGEYTRKYVVYTGYEIYGHFGWEVDDGKKDHYTVAEIVEITPEFVTLRFSDSEKEYIGLHDNYVTLKYGEEMSDGLREETDDGPNYYYTISFSDYSEE